MTWAVLLSVSLRNRLDHNWGFKLPAHFGSQSKADCSAADLRIGKHTGVFLGDYTNSTQLV